MWPVTNFGRLKSDSNIHYREIANGFVSGMQCIKVIVDVSLSVRPAKLPDSEYYLFFDIR